MIWNFLLTPAMAQATAAAPSGGQPSSLETFFPFIVLFIVMYFFLIRPQSKKQKLHQKFISDLKRGDEVITASGIFGKIDAIAEAFVTLEVANGVKIKMLRSQVAGSSQAAVKAQTTPANSTKNNKQLEK